MPWFQRSNWQKSNKSWRRRRSRGNNWWNNVAEAVASLPAYGGVDFDQSQSQAVPDIEELMPHDDLDDEVQIGTLRGDIVGIRYYNGTVNNGEMVALEREAHNRYDPNAVRVDNVAGIQVGHIKKELARALAFILDNKWARIEGLVPYGARNTYSMPVDLSFWGNPDKKECTIQKLQECGYFMRNTTASVSNSAARGKPGSSQEGGSTSATFSPTTKTFLSDNHIKSQMDIIFENQKEGNKTLEQNAAKAISTPLFKHQKQALSWMARRENEDELPPFWRELAKGRKYYNTITCYTSYEKPPVVRGGILADDMGLGKTLEMIALILTNFENGKPLSVPVEGRIRPSKLQKLERLSLYRQSCADDFEQTCYSQPEPTCSYDKKSAVMTSADSKFINDQDPGTSCKILDAKAEGIDCKTHNSEDEASMTESETDEEDEEDLTCKSKQMMDKEDPNFSPFSKIKQSLKTSIVSPNVRSRPRRSSAKHKTYRFDTDSEEDEDVSIVTDPKKKKVPTATLR